ALCEKPDPKYFAYARGRYEGAWGYLQADNLHVAQSQYHDIGVSKSLGIATCWIERRHGQKGSGGTIESEHTKPDYHFHTGGEPGSGADTRRHGGAHHGGGHDGHTSMLIGAARQLARTRRFDGMVHVIFQPAGEGKGGARAMLEAGLLERFPCDAVYALHNWP